MKHADQQMLLAELTDAMMLEWVQKGVPIYDEDGDVKGRRQPNASELQGILKRLGQCNLTVPNVGDNHLTRTAEILGRIGINDQPSDLPPLSLEDDAASG